jgi:hypothetical protein
MWPPTLLSACALLQTCLPLPYPSSQSQLSTSGMRGTSTMTGLQPVLLHLTMPNCEQLQMEFVKPTMLYWRTYVKYMSSLTLQTCSISPCTCLITWDNTCPFPFVRCWCPGSDTTQTTSLMVWTWKTISLCTSLPPRLASRQEAHQSYLLTLQDVGWSHGCSMAGTFCSGPRSTSAQTSRLCARGRTPLSSWPMLTVGHGCIRLGTVTL